MLLVAKLVNLSAIIFLLTESCCWAFTVPVHTKHQNKQLSLASTLDGTNSDRCHSLRLYKGVGSDLVSVSPDIFSQSNKNDHFHTKPRLASALEATIQWLVKYIILRKDAFIAINIDANSNRSLLQGKIKEFSLSTRDMSFRLNLLDVKRFDISSMNLRLGYLPFALPLLPFILWRLRSYIWTAILTTTVLQMIGYQISLPQVYQKLKRRLYIILGVGPSTINYSVSITQVDIDQSLLLRFWFKGILRSLVENSFVGAAAEVMKDVDMEMQRNQQREAVPLLPSSTNSNGNSGPTPPQKSLSTALTAATKCELKKAYFEDGRIVMHAQAEVGGDTTKTILPFTVRTKLIPTTVVDGQSIEEVSNNKSYNALGFATPQIRLNTDPITAGSIFGKIISDILWLPFGVGVAISFFGKACRIYRADITNDSRGKGVCRIDGSFTLFSSSSSSLAAYGDGI